MNERQPDIDALLISALYGELTPTEETRLAAHLDAHPADRTALANLTQAREAVRESRILQVQVEPPQSVSAMLLQEAARRAPAKRNDESEGFFARFFRSFMAHPAMAAAAMLVIVIGVATLVSKRNPDLARSVETTEQQAARMDVSPSAPAAGSAAPAPETSAKNDLAMPHQGSAYRVGLADGDDGKLDEAKDEGAKGGKNAEVAADYKAAKAEPTPAPVTKPRVAKESAHDNYLELRKQDQVPKDFDDAPAPAKKKAAMAPSGTSIGGEMNGETLDRTESTTVFDGNVGSFRGGAPGAASGGAATTGSTNASPPPPPPTSPRAAVTTPPARDVARADRTVDKSPAPVQAPAEEKPADPANAWAQTQHKSLIAQVKAGNCQDAANIALDLSNRAPAYYQQNVANDRSVKQCLAYITAEREKAEELRAQKNRASTTKRAADEPARAKAAKPTPSDSSK